MSEINSRTRYGEAPASGVLSSDMTGRVVVVTGAGSGVGRAAMQSFAWHGAIAIGADLHIDQHDAARLGAALAVECDVREEPAVAGLFDRVVREYGAPQAVLHCAAIGPSAAPRFEMSSVSASSAEGWADVLAVNLTGAALVSKHAIAAMGDRGGSLTHVSSINGLVGVLGADAYTASKGGIIALTRALSSDWGGRGIRVNCLCPGPIETPMNAPYLADAGRVAEMLARIPLGRVATAHEVAAAALFLASDLGSYVNGAILPVDGGWTAA
ncbi:SDR family NAD(P)-dependent oxidoreductase [Microbacterium sp.]|uniref:SDR family NAD(P)-dependent oxidoreductase n=1 Tax=Microbacterium sp. TaxID=51671 RepID=UPI003A8EB23D